MRQMFSLWNTPAVLNTKTFNWPKPNVCFFIGQKSEIVHTVFFSFSSFFFPILFISNIYFNYLPIFLYKFFNDSDSSFISAIVHNVNHNFSVPNISRTILAAYSWNYTFDNSLISEEILACLLCVQKALPAVNVSSVCDWTLYYSG